VRLRDGGAPVVTTTAAVIPIRTGQRRRLIALLAVLAIVLAFLTYQWTGPKRGAIDSLAILPFVNASGDPNKEDLSDGISENLINALSVTPNLRLTARSISFRFRGPQVDPQKAGNDLHVRAVLTGRVAERAGSLNIQCELINVEDGSQIWGRQYSRESQDILLVQEEIARDLSAKMGLKPAPDEEKRLARRNTGNSEAYRLYLKGRYYWDRRTESTLKRSIDYFQQAIAKDPGYAQAHAALAECYAVFAGHEAGAPKDYDPKAKAEAEAALKIDNTLAGAHAAMAFSLMQFDWDWNGAEREFQQAIRFEPNSASAYHWYGVFLSVTGRSEQGLTALRHAQQLEPLSLIISATLGWDLYHARLYDEAITEIGKALEMDANFATLHWWLGLPYEEKGMYQEAVAEFQKASDLSGGSPYARGALGHAYGKLGKREKALQIAVELSELGRHRYVSPYDISLIYAALNDRELTFKWLKAALEDRSWGVMSLKVDPRFDHLRGDPRLHELLRQMKLETATPWAGRL
jgi:serine/threonine-protein kinase